MDERRDAYRILMGELERRGYLKNLGVGEMIILKWIFKKWTRGKWTGVIGSGGGLL